jgi:hypothetical protein
MTTSGPPRRGERKTRRFARSLIDHRAADLRRVECEHDRRLAGLFIAPLAFSSQKKGPPPGYSHPLDPGMVGRNRKFDTPRPPRLAQCETHGVRGRSGIATFQSADNSLWFMRVIRGLWLCLIPQPALAS